MYSERSKQGRGAKSGRKYDNGLLKRGFGRNESKGVPSLWKSPKGSRFRVCEVRLPVPGIGERLDRKKTRGGT